MNAFFRCDRSIVLHFLSPGTRRTDEPTSTMDTSQIQVRVGAKTTSMVAAAEEKRLLEESNQVAFTRSDLSFIDLKYEVTVSAKDETTGKTETKQRQLLAGINGFARAGELTALMGSSGAGELKDRVVILFLKSRAHSHFFLCR